jgi:hypothetical protein
MKKTPEPSTPSEQFTGKRLSRVRVIHDTQDGGRLLEIDWRDPLTERSIERYKLAAIALLETAGIAAREILAEHPGGSMLRDHVLNDREHDADSALGLAARICELCIRLQELPRLGASPEMLAGDAYRLGRLTAIADAYATHKESALSAASSPRKKEDVTRAQVRAAWFKDIENNRPLRGRVQRVAVETELSEGTVALIRDALNLPRNRS